LELPGGNWGDDKPQQHFDQERTYRRHGSQNRLSCSIRELTTEDALIDNQAVVYDSLHVLASETESMQRDGRIAER
jgi:hypothetical protein